VKYPLYKAVKTNQKLLKRTTANNVATMKIMDGYHYEKKASCSITKSTHFPVRKYEWDTKE